MIDGTLMGRVLWPFVKAMIDATVEREALLDLLVERGLLSREDWEVYLAQYRLAHQDRIQEQVLLLISVIAEPDDDPGDAPPPSGDPA